MRTTAASWVKTMADLARAEGLDAETLFRQAGLDMQALARPHARFPQDNISRLWQLMAEASGKPGIGLDFGRHVSLATFGAVGYLFLCAPTVKSSLEHLLGYQGYLGEALVCRLEKQGESYHFGIRNVGDKAVVARQALDAILSSFLSLAAWIFRQPVPIRELWIGHVPETELDLYRQRFQCPVSFHSGDTVLVLDAAWVESWMPTADPLMLAQHEKWAAAIVARSQQPFVSQIKQLIKSLLPNGEARKDTVAASLHMGAKTLQRRLEEAGAGFQQLLDECRQELACELLQQPHVELIEIAELTGYSDYSTFAKAFRQWTGQTPKGWREGLH